MKPIYKDGKRSDLNNYKPWAYFWTSSKIINEELTEYLEANKTINDHQDGFRAASNTTSALFDLMRQSSSIGKRSRKYGGKNLFGHQKSLRYGMHRNSSKWNELNRRCRTIMWMVPKLIIISHRPYSLFTSLILTSFTWKKHHFNLLKHAHQDKQILEGDFETRGYCIRTFETFISTWGCADFCHTWNFCNFFSGISRRKSK